MVLACIVTEIKSRKFTVKDLRSERKSIEKRYMKEMGLGWAWPLSGYRARNSGIRGKK